MNDDELFEHVRQFREEHQLTDEAIRLLTITTAILARAMPRPRMYTSDRTITIIQDRT